MIDLRNEEEIKKLDPKNVYGSTGMFAHQCQYMLDTYYDTDFYSDEYKQAKNIVMCGMGGSAYGGYIANALFHDSLKMPIIGVNDYHLPAFASEDSLIFLSSYSGSTEEVLSCGGEAKEKNLKITGFASGGKLGELLKEKYPGFTFNPEFNPSGQPRLGTGYMVLGVILLLNSLGVISVSKEEIQKAIDEVKDGQEDVKTHAMEMAKEIEGYIPVIMGAEFLNGNIHIMRNQLNETAKSFSAFSELPELNHHLLEGLKNPTDKKLKVIFINSNFYSPKLQKRMTLTKDVVKQNGVEYVEYTPGGSSKFSQMLEVLSFGGYFSLYLALIYGQDPSLIPWVDYFKEQLSK